VQSRCSSWKEKGFQDAESDLGTARLLIKFDMHPLNRNMVESVIIALANGRRPALQFANPTTSFHDGRLIGRKAGFSGEFTMLLSLIYGVD
jgi:hypothetical protein